MNLILMIIMELLDLEIGKCYFALRLCHPEYRTKTFNPS